MAGFFLFSPHHPNTYVFFCASGFFFHEMTTTHQKNIFWPCFPLGEKESRGICEDKYSKKYSFAGVYIWAANSETRGQIGV